MSDRNNTMNSPPAKPLTETEIHAFVDDQLSAATRADVQRRLAQNPDRLAEVLKWQQQRDALRGLHLQVLDEACPAPMISAAHQALASQQDLNQWWRWGGMAASLLLAFGVGWFSNAGWRAQWQSQASSGTLVSTRLAQDFARQASYAHGVYSPEIRHPVEVTAADQEHLVQWLSKRVGKPLRVPNLAALGYELVGGRLLPGEMGARAQFMFQNAMGMRITLYLGAVNKVPDTVEAQETSFHFSTDGPIPSFYWIDQGFGYALAGPVQRDALLKLAEAVYRQL